MAAWPARGCQVPRARLVPRRSSCCARGSGRSRRPGARHLVAGVGGGVV